MRKNYARLLYAMVLIVFTGYFAIGQTTITQWTFEPSPGTITPTVGTGVATLVGGTTATFAGGTGGTGTFAWNTTTYPATTANSGTAGVQFVLSTTGYNNITVSWDQRNSATAANRTRLQYTTDGTTWLNFDASDANATNLNGTTNLGFDAGRYITSAGTVWINRSANLSAITGINNNPNFGIRIVTEFADGVSYVGVSSTYAPGGTIRFDNVTVAGTAAGGTPSIVVNPTTLTGFSYAINNGPSASQSYALSGSSLTPAAGNITVTPSTNYEVSLNNTSFSSTAVTVPYTGGTLAATNIYVRLKAGLPAGNYNGEVITNAGGGATTANVTVSGTVSNPATHLAFNNFPATGFINQAVASFTVQALNAAEQVDPAYTGNITLTKVSGPGNLAGTLTQAAVAGVATFADISFTATGSYVLQATATGLTPATSTTITISLPPAITADILPQYMSGNTPSNNRVPFAYRATLTNLLPNATYRFMTSAVTSSDGPTAGGAGVLIYVNADGTFSRYTTGSFTEGYGEFTTNASGSYSGWFMLEPSGNARFDPGNLVFMRIRLNNGDGGTTAVHYLTTTESVTVLQWSSDSTAISGSALRATSLATPKNFAMLYDNVAGTGRPLFGTSIETIGLEFSAITQYAPFYRNEVSGHNGAWGAIIPNLNPNGVRRIEERSLTTGAIVSQENSADGVWGFTDTRDPNYGLDSVLVIHLTPEIVSQTVPAYIQGVNGTNNQRVPLSFYATISYLRPNSVYRYYNKAVVTADAITVDGAGNTILAESDGTFTRTTASSMNTAGQYGEFTADNMGNYSGWFMLESTADNRFTPGNNVRMRIMLNNGQGGTTVATRLTTADSASVINFSQAYNDVSGTGIRGESLSASGNMVFIYGNESGTGQPLFSSSIETTGIAYSSLTNYADFYLSDVAGVNGAWGGIVPNVMPEGVRRIEERSNADGSLVAVWTSPNGVWGNVDTRNPQGGEGTELVINLIPTGDPVLTVIPSTLTGFTYIEGNGPSASQAYTLSAMDLEGSGNIVVTGSENYEVSLDNSVFTNSVEVPFAEGVITGQPVSVYVRLRIGLPMGEYNDEVITNVGGGAPDALVTASGTVTTSAFPSLTNVVLPQYIEGLNGTNINRVPFAYRGTLSYLLPNTTYRYYNKIVIETDVPDFNGAGNTIFVNADGTFTRTTSTSLETPGEYGEFTTDNTGSWTGWFITEPSGNDRFTPGNHIYMRININDGNNGTAVDQRFTTAQYATVLTFGTEASATQGTAIHAISNDIAGNFVFLYDGTDNTQRPIYGTQIESTGVDFCAPGVYAPFYCEEITGVSGSWGGIVPNVNANGIQRIDVLANADGAITHTYTMPTGIWNGTDTRNPAGGVDSVLFINLKIIGVNDIDAMFGKVWSYDNTIVIQPENRGSYNVTLINMQGIQVAESKQIGESRINFNVPAGIYVVRISTGNSVYSAKVYIR